MHFETWHTNLTYVSVAPFTLITFPDSLCQMPTMANPKLCLTIALAFVISFHCCLSTTTTGQPANVPLHRQQGQNERQIQSSSAQEPQHQIESEAGVTPCGDVFAFPETIQPTGLVLPGYTDPPLLVDNTVQVILPSWKHKRKITSIIQSWLWPTKTPTTRKQHILQFQHQDPGRGVGIGSTDHKEVSRTRSPKRRQHCKCRSQSANNKATKEHRARRAARRKQAPVWTAAYVLEETISSARRFTILNRFYLPTILKYLQLSAERGAVYRNAIRSLNSQQNALTVVPKTRSGCQMQIVDHPVPAMLRNRLQDGQHVNMITPQNFVATSQACEQGTNTNPMFHTLRHVTSLVLAMPVDVLANAYQISHEEARRLNFNRKEPVVYEPSRPARIIADA